MNTPFQWTKQVASHFGGTRNPMIISWPARIKDKGGMRSSRFLHTASTSFPPFTSYARRDPAHRAQRCPTKADRKGLALPFTFDDAKELPVCARRSTSNSP